jgi:hypothetical protein
LQIKKLARREIVTGLNDVVNHEKLAVRIDALSAGRKYPDALIIRPVMNDMFRTYLGPVKATNPAMPPQVCESLFRKRTGFVRRIVPRHRRYGGPVVVQGGVVPMSQHLAHLRFAGRATR